MAASVTHQKVSTVPPTSDPDLVSSNDWNDEHEVVITAADISAAPVGADYLVGTTQAGLSSEIVVGTSPGGELGGTWASPTVDTTHSGSSHSGVVTTHEAASDPHTGYVLESLMDTAGDLFVASGDNTVARLAKGSAGQMLQAQSSSLSWIDYQRSITFSKQGVLAASTVGVHRWYNDTGRTLTFTAIRASVGTAPTGSLDITVDVNVNGTTIMTGTKVVIALTTFTVKQTTFSTATIADGEYITVDIDRVGGTVAGSDLTVAVWMKG